MIHYYSAATGVLHLIQALNNGAADGTGILRLETISKHLLGPKIPEAVISYSVETQWNLFGNYPTLKDIAPSAVFTVLFFLALVVHCVIFAINTSRGHYFWVSLAWIFYCVLKTIGFAFRAVWASDITLIKYGLAGEVFLIVPSVILVSFNLILAQRLFTWRHPVGGSRWLFWNFMFSIYTLVVLFVVITIVASCIPYLYFLSDKVHYRYQKVIQATAVIVVLYSLTSISLIALSYFFKPTTKDENLYTYQPWWIKSFSPFYFVEPQAAQKAEETFMKRNHNHRHAIRVIAATHHHYNMVEGLTNERGTLKHNVSLGLLFTSTILIFIGSIGRCIAVFRVNEKRDGGLINLNILMYFCWGVFEFIIQVLYIVGRVDLRFYRPDVLPARVKAIITAEQTYYPSDEEDIDPDESSTTSSSPSVIDPEKASYRYPAQTPPYPTTPRGEKYEKYKGVEDDDSDFFF